MLQLRCFLTAVNLKVGNRLANPQNELKHAAKYYKLKRLYHEDVLVECHAKVISSLTHKQNAPLEL